MEGRYPYHMLPLPPGLANRTHKQLCGPCEPSSGQGQYRNISLVTIMHMKTRSKKIIATRLSNSSQWY